MRDTFFHEQLQFARSLKIKINASLAEIGIYHSQWLVLFAIHKSKSASLVEISNYLDVEKPTITRTVRRLEEQMFVVEITSEDKRERRVQLTEKGTVVYEKGQQIIDQFELNFVEVVSKEDFTIARDTMRKLKETLQKGDF